MKNYFLTLTLIIFLMIAADKVQAAFEENARRYLSAQEIIQTLSVYFNLSSSCNSIDSSDSSKLGVDSPISGNPIAPAPTQSTVQWIASCVSEATDDFLNSTDSSQDKLKNLVGAEAYAYISPPNSPTFSYDLNQHLNQAWKDWPADIRAKLIASAVDSMLGSDDVINDFGLIDPNVLRSKLSAWADPQPQLTALQMIRFLSVNLSLRDEFLSY